MHCVFSSKYPSYIFVSSRLRELRKKRGDQFATGTVRFHRGILDTKIQGFDEEEAEAIYQDISQTPQWQVSIKPVKWYDKEGKAVAELPASPSVQSSQVVVVKAKNG
jgi:hypothetical protein